MDIVPNGGGVRAANNHATFRPHESLVGIKPACGDRSWVDTIRIGEIPSGDNNIRMADPKTLLDDSESHRCESCQPPNGCHKDRFDARITFVTKEMQMLCGAEKKKAEARNGPRARARIVRRDPVP